MSGSEEDGDMIDDLAFPTSTQARAACDSVMSLREAARAAGGMPE